MMRHSIVIADDHPVVLRGLRDLLGSEPEFTLLAACRDGVEALETIRNKEPRLALLDFAMPGMSGLDVLHHARAWGIPTRFVLLTALASKEQVLEAVASGAHGFLYKNSPVEELLRCLREVANGGKYMAPDLVEAALATNAGQTQYMADALTLRERQVVKLLTEGLSNKEIGRKLDLSEGTVKIHLHKVYGKLGVANRTALTALALAHRKLRSEP